MQKIKRTSLKNGLTLVEVLISIVIIVFVVLSLLQAFIYFSILANSTENISTVTFKAQSKMEEIRGHDFDDIPTDFGSGGTPGDVFMLTLSNDGVEGAGVIYIDTVNSDLLKTTIVVSWRNKDGRIIGGDHGGSDPAKALNGAPDTGEDLDGGRLTSPMLTLVSYIAKRL